MAIGDPHPVLADCPHGQLGLERHADLADNDHVQRRAQRAGHLRGDRHAAARQAEDDDWLTAQMLQPPGQLAARIITTSEHHDHPPFPTPHKTSLAGYLRTCVPPSASVTNASRTVARPARHRPA